MKQYDIHFEDRVITEVNEHDASWSILCGATEFGFHKKDGVHPKVGDTARFYGKGFGYRVRGLDINGIEVFYRTEAQADNEDHNEALKAKEQRKTEWQSKRTEYNERWAKLPQVFQDRISGFHKRNPDFGPEYEPYELFVCEQAVAFATALKTKSAISDFHRSSYEEQRKLVAEMSEEHSGNTFGTACMLSRLLIDRPDLVANAHGALCPLVGCADYGCWSAGEEAQSARAKADLKSIPKP